MFGHRPIFHRPRPLNVVCHKIIFLSLRRPGCSGYSVFSPKVSRTKSRLDAFAVGDLFERLVRVLGVVGADASFARFVVGQHLVDCATWRS
jgi:hypothetical protein